MPSSMASTLTVPVGMMASGTSLPARPLMVSLTVPSPPTAQTMSNPALTASRARRLASPGSVVSSSSTT